MSPVTSWGGLPIPDSFREVAIISDEGLKAAETTATIAPAVAALMLLAAPAVSMWAMRKLYESVPEFARRSLGTTS